MSSSKISVSIDVANLDQAVAFYTGALGCSRKKRFNDQWEVVSLDGFDLHLQEVAEGSIAAAQEQRHYQRHWTPVHLDFGVTDIKSASTLIEQHGGTVERQSFDTYADIAVCADPFGNGFCVIRE